MSFPAGRRVAWLMAATLLATAPHAMAAASPDDHVLRLPARGPHAAAGSSGGTGRVMAAPKVAVSGAPAPAAIKPPVWHSDGSGPTHRVRHAAHAKPARKA